MIKSLIPFGKGALFLAGALFLSAPSLHALDVPSTMQTSDVVLLGEVHDNRRHHEVQAALLTELQPKAVVWEMLTAEQAQILTPELLGDTQALENALEWAQSGWPDFGLYAPVFAAAPQALHFGGQVPRSESRRVMEDGIVAVFGEGAGQFGLDQPLANVEQAQREQEQFTNHCEAIPVEMLPMMVDFQRLRDANLARAVIQALAETGGPVAVITGNGHARRDRGIPVYLLKADPELTLFALGQSEDGVSSGVFDMVLDAPAAEREDPCLAFK
ncbi:MAG: hypothetical protein GJ676_09940 [Rhodobacteraceae bacterium]|nr:hypothetical protein [Paracoccaceae bacterium]